MSCSICDQIPPSLEASDTEHRPFPDVVYKLKRRTHFIGSSGSTVADFWECPECGLLYTYTIFIGVVGAMKGGDSDLETLDRLTRDQTDVVRAMLACKADPATIEDALFALPDIALGETLRAAYANDRDFVALFIPRLVTEYARRPGRHDPDKLYAPTPGHETRDIVDALIETQPSYAREVLTAITALPDELRAKLARLEERCTKALA